MHMYANSVQKKSPFGGILSLGLVVSLYAWRARGGPQYQWC